MDSIAIAMADLQDGDFHPSISFVLICLHLSFFLEYAGFLLKQKSKDFYFLFQWTVILSK